MKCVWKLCDLFANTSLLGMADGNRKAKLERKITNIGQKHFITFKSEPVSLGIFKAKSHANRVSISEALMVGSGFASSGNHSD